MLTWGEEGAGGKSKREEIRVTKRKKKSGGDVGGRQDEPGRRGKLLNKKT